MKRTRTAAWEPEATAAMAVPEAPIVFLAGPPGSGKTTLGRRACERLGLRFLDSPGDDAGRPDQQLTILDEAIRSRSADVVALSWELQQDAGLLRSCRKDGALVALWAHPLDMRARSMRQGSLFTPVGRLRTHGGFGRLGTGCCEYRRLGRACDHVVLLVGRSLDDAADELRAIIAELRAPDRGSPAEREGLLGWAAEWAKAYGVDAEACRILVDAMARYGLHLRSQGASPRKMAAVYGDLDAAGLLVTRSEAPKGKKVLDAFRSVPCTYDFRRMISDSPRATARYGSNLVWVGVGRIWCANVVAAF
ncbi:MAG: hypothetical protein HY744_22805 [Deltaproteobacteria bacterium]|nr:hypothetical protein [Deltaproteobacteria bacterium]